MRRRSSFFLLFFTVLLLFFISCSEYTTNPELRVATPVFDPDGGEFSESVLVEITCETGSSTIRYTTDSSEPTLSSTEYTEPINVSTDTVLKARGFKDGWESSQVAEANFYIIEPEVPETTAPEAGDGSEDNPYHISSLENLYWIRADHERYDKHYIQTSNIDASTTMDWFDGRGWQPIGSSEHVPFSGTYDGQGHRIDGIYIRGQENTETGLFGLIEGAVIKNLRVTNVDIDRDDIRVGALAGQSINSTISSCQSSGSVSGISIVGGLAGFLTDSTLDNSHSTCNVTGNDTMIGGLTGGMVNSSVSNSYSRGNIAGNAFVGGLAGRNGSGSNIADCYSTGSVVGDDNQGGLVGGTSDDATVSNSFWDIETSGQTSSAGGEGKTTAELNTETTFTDAGWDFSNYWAICENMNDGYPYLFNNLPY